MDVAHRVRCDLLGPVQELRRADRFDIAVVVDLHAHYPMHLVPDAPGGLWHLLTSALGRRQLGDRIRAFLITSIASPIGNYQSLFSRERVNVRYMQEGGVRVAYSVLYSFFDEADVDDGPQPQADYFPTLLRQLEAVEKHVREKHPNDVAIVSSRAELTAALDGGRLALIHCVEGGFHLGAEPATVTEAVRVLAGKGVAYITLAHLIWRGVATDAPALPFLTEEQYRRWLPQPPEGLSALGEAAVRAMVAHRVLIDISHMSDRAVEETLGLLDEIDPSRAATVISSHAGFRFGDQEYMHTPDTIRRIAERDGVIGLIFAVHQLENGLDVGMRPKLRVTKAGRFERGFETICHHIDAIHRVTGTHRHTAIGSDFDGFIKPTLPGLRDMRDMARLEAALVKRYGAADAELLCSGNALRVLERIW